MQVKAVAFYWYPSEDDYKKMQSSAEDGSTMHETYAEWLIAAETGIENFKSTPDISVRKMEVPTDEFIAWCNSTGHKLNSESRSAIANHKLCLLMKDD
jgi:hypothetical protein